MEDKKLIHILNLLEKTPESLNSYWDNGDFNIVKREDVTEYEKLDFIFVDTEEEAFNAFKDFDCLKNEIEIVCLGNVKEMRSFLTSNGRLSIDPEFLQSKMGEAILNKFFGKEFNIHLDESFNGQFPDVDNFKVVNHLAVGESLDRLSLEAFEKDFNIVSLRSFLDHTLIYFTYLKQAGLAGIPFEVEYSSNSDFFAVNIHAPVKNFAAEYLLDSFGSVNSKDPIQYLLGVASRSADFMDITHVRKPGRVVFSAFWSKSEKRGLNGIAFNNILTTAQMNMQLEKKIKEFQPSLEEANAADEKAEDLRTKSLPGGILAMALKSDKNSFFGKEPETASNLVAFVIGRFEEIHPDQTINDMGEDDLKKILEGHPEKDVVEKLSKEDKEELLDQIQKKNITDAYQEELERTRSSLKEDDDFKKDLFNTFSDEVVKRVSGHLDADTLNRIVSGKEDKDGFTANVGGKEDVDAFKAIIQGTKENHKSDFTTVLGGSFESKLGEFNNFLSRSPDEPSKGLFDFVTKTMASLNKLDVDNRAKSFFRERAPHRISEGLKKYSEEIGIDYREFTEKHLKKFKDDILPSIVEETLSAEPDIEEYAIQQVEKGEGVFQNATPEFRNKFKEKLEQRLEEFEGLEIIDDKYVFTDESVEKDKAQELIQLAMREALNEEYQFQEGSREEIEEKERKVIQDLSSTLVKEQGEVTDIIKGAVEATKEKETQTVVANLFQEKPGEKEDVVVKEFQGDAEEVKASASPEKEDKRATDFDEAALMGRLKKAEDENKKLKDTVKALQANNDSKVIADKRLKEIDKTAKEEANTEVEASKATNLEEKVEEFEKAVQAVEQTSVEKLRAGKKLDSEEALKVAAAIEREQALLASAKEAQTNIRKLEIEIKKKESQFISEVAKAEKTSKSKDIVLEKIKSTMQNMLEKKHKEVIDFKRQVEHLNQRLKDDRATKLEADLKKLSKDFESVSRIAEMYKTKVEGMVKKEAKSSNNNQSEQLASENRTLSRLKTQLENKLNAEMREKKSIETQFEKIKAQEGKLRARATGAESQMKKHIETIDKMKANEARLVALANKKESGADQKLVKEIDTLKRTNTQLQASLKDMAEKMKAGGATPVAAASNDNASTKEKQLEASVKKLNKELSNAKEEVNEAKKTVQKAKSETVGLKNKIKQLEKALAAAAAKKGGKKAA